MRMKCNTAQGLPADRRAEPLSKLFPLPETPSLLFSSGLTPVSPHSAPGALLRPLPWRHPSRECPSLLPTALCWPVLASNFISLWPDLIFRVPRGFSEETPIPEGRTTAPPSWLLGSPAFQFRLDIFNCLCCSSLAILLVLMKRTRWWDHWWFPGYFSHALFGWESRNFTDGVPSFTEQLTGICGQWWVGCPCCGPPGLLRCLLPSQEGPCQVSTFRVCCHGDRVGPGQGEAASYRASALAKQNGEGRVSQDNMWNGRPDARRPVTWLSGAHLYSTWCQVWWGSLENVK